MFPLLEDFPIIGSPLQLYLIQLRMKKIKYLSSPIKNIPQSLRAVGDILCYPLFFNPTLIQYVMFHTSPHKSL